MSNETSPARKAVLRLEGVGKVYIIGSSKLRALDNVSLEVYQGEFVCICGRSGSGKSTLLNMMAGLEPPTRGKIMVAGEQIEKMNERRLVAFRLNHIGFIFQQFNLFPYMTALENVTMPLVYRGVPVKKRRQMAADALKAVGLMSHASHKPSQMSGGQQQRVGIARALVADPPILFADEPTGNLDSKTSDEILTLIRDITRKIGCTMIMVTHDPEIAQKADRVIHLLDGHITGIEINKENLRDAHNTVEEVLA